MHASVEQLIALRDGQPLAAEAAAHVRSCAECGQALLRLSDWRQRLRTLPAFDAPENVWARVAGRLDQPADINRARWLPAAGIGLAASLAAVVVLVFWHPWPAENRSAVVTAGAALDAGRLAQLQAQSRYLENAVQFMSADSHSSIVNVGSAATVAALEDRIALVDYAINSTAARPQTGGQLTQLWQQRVDLMQSLVAVRYAQAAAMTWNQ